MSARSEAGLLAPWASPSDCSPGWEVTVGSRLLADAIAAQAGGDARHADGGRWRVVIPGTDLAVTALDVSDGTLRCTLAAAPDAVLAVRLPRWNGPDDLPAHGTLTNRRRFFQTRMGNRYLTSAPVFTAAGAAPSCNHSSTPCNVPGHEAVNPAIEPARGLAS